MGQNDSGSGAVMQDSSLILLSDDAAAHLHVAIKPASERVIRSWKGGTGGARSGRHEVISQILDPSTISAGARPQRTAREAWGVAWKVALSQDHAITFALTMVLKSASSHAERSLSKDDDLHLGRMKCPNGDHSEWSGRQTHRSFHCSAA